MKSPEAGESPEQQESGAERELNEYGEQMKQALSDLVVSKSGSEADLREAFEDSLVINQSFDNVIGDIKGNLDLDALQEVLDKLVSKHSLDARKFSVHRLHKLIKKSEE
jgi:hypothetical protein